MQEPASIGVSQKVVLNKEVPFAKTPLGQKLFFLVMDDLKDMSSLYEFLGKMHKFIF